MPGLSAGDAADVELQCIQTICRILFSRAGQDTTEIEEDPEAEPGVHVNVCGPTKALPTQADAEGEDASVKEEASEDTSVSESFCGSCRCQQTVSGPGWRRQGGRGDGNQGDACCC